MTIENIENHMAYTCKCGGVDFALLKYGAFYVKDVVYKCERMPA